MAWIPTREGKPGMWSVGDPGTRKSAMHSLSIYTKCSTGAERNASFQMRAPRFVEYFKVRTTSLEVKSQRRGPELAFDVGVLGERRLRPSSRWSPTPPAAQLDRSAGSAVPVSCKGSLELPGSRCCSTPGKRNTFNIYPATHSTIKKLITDSGFALGSLNGISGCAQFHPESITLPQADHTISLTITGEGFSYIVPPPPGLQRF